ncbi:hypothetical protein NL108_005935 [Boleophthalmus pectinirostris]|nr:hypothetical protein NL108_005935 [Boleophthalmus pectinirostris]
MDVRNGEDKAIAQTAQVAAVATDTERVCADVQTVKPKERRTIKLTAKAFADKLEKLQSNRKTKLNKAANLRKTIQDLIQKESQTSEIQNVFDELLVLCEDVKAVHDTVMDMLPDVEKEKHNVWFKAKMIANEVFISDVKACLAGSEFLTFDANVNTDDRNYDNEIHPHDSASMCSEMSKRTMCKSHCSTASSALIQVEAERAALLEEARILKEKHAIEEQEQQLKRRKEQLELEAKLAASAAKIAVLESYKGGSRVSANSKMSGDGEQRKKVIISQLHPNSKEFKPVMQDEPEEIISWSPPPISRPQTVEPVANSHTNTNIVPPTVQIDQGIPQKDICSILERQNEITAALVKQQLLLSLPIRDIPVFNGDPLLYIPFCRAFKQGVEDRASKGDCLYYLEQFTSGLPKELVRSCLHMEPESGFVRAKQLLREQFGDEYRIACAYMEKVFSWPAIKSEDLDALQSYTLFLRACCNVMMDLHSLKDLDAPTNMRAILAKLPYRLRERWRNTAYDIMDTTSQRATFKDLVAFVERQVKILSDPLFGSIPESSAGSGGSRSRSQPNTARGSSFATRVAPLAAQDRGVKAVNSVTCDSCSEGHLLVDCPQFKIKGHKEKMDFLRERRLCFGCLCAGHLRRDCENIPTCDICGRLHHVVLHINRNGEPATSQTCGLTGAGTNNCFLPIVPVRVKSSKCDKAIDVYAFLDPGSSTTFCSEDLMKRLNLPGKRTHFVLQTMGQERVVSAHSLTGLKVSALETDIFYELPDVFTQNKMPVNADSVATEKDLTRWQYLSKVKVPSIKANVDLIIGSNAPKLLEPLEVILSQQDGPYAIKTALGWAVNGSSVNIKTK